MKKLLSLIFAFLLLTSSVYPATLILDDMEYATDGVAQAAYVTDAAETTDVSIASDSGGYWSVGNPTGTDGWKVAQSFKLSADTILSAVEFKRYISTLGTPTGNWRIRIETNNAGQPSGTLADINATVDVAPPAEGAVKKCIFAKSFLLLGATTYHAVIQAADVQSTGNAWRIDSNDADVYADGTASYFTTSWSNVVDDFYFKAYVISLQSYSEATIKTQGSYALKAVATTGAINKTLTKTASLGNLTGVKNLRFDAYALRTGAQWKLGIHDTGGTTTEITPTIATSNTWQPNNWDFSAVSDANKDAIDTLTFTITNADSANTVYLDYAEIAQAIDVWGWVN